jgi:hypothetical protein
VYVTDCREMVVLLFDDRLLSMSLWQLLRGPSL